VIGVVIAALPTAIATAAAIALLHQITARRARP
jgi:hypothetical protein